MGVKPVAVDCSAIGHLVTIVIVILLITRGPVLEKEKVVVGVKRVAAEQPASGHMIGTVYASQQLRPPPLQQQHPFLHRFPRTVEHTMAG